MTSSSPNSSRRRQLLPLFIPLLLATSALAQNPGLPAPRPEVPARDHGPSVTRVFSVADIINTTRDYPLKTSLTTPDRMSGSDAPLSGERPPLYSSSRKTPPPPRSLDSLIALITETVFFGDLPTDSARLGVFGDSLIISAPQAQITQVESLLAELRKESAPSPIVRIELVFLSLDPIRANELASSPDFSLGPYLKDATIYTATGYAGQTLFVASGRATQSLTNVQPVVGTQAVGYSGTTVLLLQGVTAQFSATLSRDTKTAQLNLEGSYCANLRSKTPDASANFPPGFEADTWQFASATTFPAGPRYTLLARTTLDSKPQPPQPPLQNPGRPPGEAAPPLAPEPPHPGPRQLLLYARVLTALQPSPDQP